MKRIISLAPSATEILFFLGLGERVAGVTEQCDFPGKTSEIEKIGSFMYPDAEKIASLKPDLVVACGEIHERFQNEFKNKKIPVFTLSPRTVEDILQDMEKLACLNGQIDLKNSPVGLLRKRLEDIERDTQDNPPPRVFRLMGESPMSTPTPGSYQYHAIIRAGGEPMNIHTTQEAYAQVTLREVVAFDPQVIITCGGNRDQEPKKRCTGCRLKNPPCQRVIDDMKAWKGWEKISAVKNENVLPLPCDLICRPGPRLVTGIMRMAKFINLCG